MALRLNFQEKEGIKDLIFNTALFIEVPSWTKDDDTEKSLNEISSSENTPDKNKTNGINISLADNLISKDLLKKLEAESPFNFDKHKINSNFIRKKLDFSSNNEEDQNFPLTKIKRINKNLHEEGKNGLEINSLKKSKREFIKSDNKYFKEKSNSNYKKTNKEKEKENEKENELKIDFSNSNNNNNFYFLNKEFINNKIINNSNKISNSNLITNSNLNPNLNNIPIYEINNLLKLSNSDNNKKALNHFNYPNFNYNNSKDLINFNKNSIHLNQFYKQNYINYIINQSKNSTNQTNRYLNLNSNNDNLNENKNHQTKNDSKDMSLSFNSFENNNIYNNPILSYQYYFSFNNYSNINNNNNQKMSINEEHKIFTDPFIKSGMKVKATNKIYPKSENNKKIKKPFIERDGDWLCLQCNNHNFSFRNSCNRCQNTREENEALKNIKIENNKST